MNALILVLSVLGAQPGGAPQAREMPVAEPIVILQQQQAEVFARRGGTIVRSGTGPRDPIVAELAQNEAVAVIAQEGMRYQIRTSRGVVGYVAKLNMTEIRPAGASSPGMFSVRDDLAAGQRSNVTAIRGLSPTSERLGGDAVTPELIQAYKDVKQLSSTITGEELEAFAAQGGVDPL